MEIHKTVFTFTVLHPSDYYPQSLEDALEESDTGGAVGAASKVTTVVKDADVANELIDLGNDGDFFDQMFEEPRTLNEVATYFDGGA